jgi:O-acetyl-ADP-ribose deacetylase (regulator of RNase III)
VWRGGDAREPELLARCYRGTLALARDHGLVSIAFPAISCGAFGYPWERAAAVARESIEGFLGEDESLERVILAALDPRLVAMLRTEFPER